jgi:putative ABC transport system ATP-binding protein
VSSVAPAQPLTAAQQVVIDNLIKQYGSLRALNGVNFAVHAGEWVALMGPSGSGKTTLINILGGLDTLTSGSVVVDGVDLSKLGESQVVRYRAEKVGFVFQQFHLVPYLTALENVMLAQYFHSVTDEKQAEDALKRVGLGDRLTHLPAQLSGGEQQRVAIARALINQPKLILADEPTGNLDEANETIVLQIFRELHNAGHTILMVTHDPDIARQADRRIELAHGHLHFDSALHGPSHPLNCPLADTGDYCTLVSTDDEIRFDHLLEQIWICGEEGKPAQVERLRASGPAGKLAIVPEEPAVRVLSRMSERHLVAMQNGEVHLTPVGSQRARDVVRRHQIGRAHV